ncbi:hypothetical protein Vadar_014920 [Vaccinium darrowii]|uniref:Uncharacterized protein n=1 Tax=Vaccinium darrowii TaxID=229202 RepID=A0ACB7ZJM2_9ERIC|nr:hypothetical protein Vadar_014920 [Vaccinium darrowii]
MVTKRSLSWTQKSGMMADKEHILELILGDEKERVKHVKMLSLEKFNISKVTGELFEHLSCWDALQAALPIAIVSGVPKVSVGLLQ